MNETDPFSSLICHHCYEVVFVLSSKICMLRWTQDMLFKNKDYIENISIKMNVSILKGHEIPIKNVDF